VVHPGSDDFSLGVVDLPFMAVLAALMVGEAARPAVWRWRSPLCGHVQRARGVPGLHGGGRDGVAFARLGWFLNTVC
jgi:hypothetical protein